MEMSELIKLLRVSEKDFVKLEEANKQVRNVILVPCCYEEREGVFVNYDDMMDSSDTFLVQRDALAGFSAEDVVEFTVSNQLESDGR